MNGYRLSKMAQREIDSILDYVAEHSGMVAAGIVRFTPEIQRWEDRAGWWHGAYENSR